MQPGLHVRSSSSSKWYHPMPMYVRICKYHMHVAMRHLHRQIAFGRGIWLFRSSLVHEPSISQALTPSRYLLGARHGGRPECQRALTEIESDVSPSTHLDVKSLEIACYKS
jgi:hypothetical protein